jgi:hypothetical protein
VLLGVLADPAGGAARTLRAIGVDTDEVRSGLDATRLSSG